MPISDSNTCIWRRRMCTPHAKRHMLWISSSRVSWLYAELSLRRQRLHLHPAIWPVAASNYQHLTLASSRDRPVRTRRRGQCCKSRPPLQCCVLFAYFNKSPPPPLTELAGNRYPSDTETLHSLLRGADTNRNVGDTLPFLLLLRCHKHLQRLQIMQNDWQTRLFFLSTFIISTNLILNVKRKLWRNLQNRQQ